MDSIEISFFNNAYADTTPKPMRGSLEELGQFLSKPYPYHPELVTARQPKGDKLGNPAIVPGIFNQGGHRCIADLDYRTAIMLDFDNHAENPPTMYEVAVHLQAIGLSFYTYFTFSSSMDQQRFRVFIPLDHRVEFNWEGTDWYYFTEWALFEMELVKWKDQIDLPHLRDPARLSFLQCCPDPSDLGYYNGLNQGHPLLWDLDRIIKYAQNLSEAERPPSSKTKSEADREYYRTHFSHLNLKTLDLPALWRAQGLYIGPPRPTRKGTEYPCECPWQTTHTGQKGEASILETNGPPAFHCFHTHEENNLIGILKYFGDEVINNFTQTNII